MTSPSHPDLLQPGDAVWHYQVVRHLGSGGFSTVLLVEHAGQEFTMKLATRPPSQADESRTDERAFREAVALGHFRHPHLPEVRELGRWPDLKSGFFFVVTDYIPGSTFNPWRWRTQPSLHRFVSKLAEVAAVVADLHERGVVHRDLKADNILVRDGDEKPFLADFGSASLPGGYPLTQVLPPGTFHNMPPECAAFLLGGEWESGARLPAHPAMDLYGLGTLLYEALTDCHAFNPRLPRHVLALAIESLPPVPPLRLDPRVPPGLNDLTMRLLAKKPEQRPASAQAVHEELLRMLKTEGKTEPWTVPYGFAEPSEDAALAIQRPKVLGEGGEPARRPEEPMPRPEEGPVPPPGEKKAETPPPAGQPEGARKAPGWRKWGVALLVLALGWVLLGVGWKGVRAGYATAVEVACSGADRPEKGLHPMFSFHRADDTPSQPSLCALLCTWAAAAHLAACASAPVRPDMGRVLEQCPPEARATASRLGLEPIMEVQLMTVTCAGSVPPNRCNAVNVKSGPMEGMLVLQDETILRVTGEAKVFPDRVYISFDRVYPKPEGPPEPLCGVVLNDDTDRFGVTTHAALPPTTGLHIDPERVDRSPDATVLRFPMVYTYIQGPKGSFQPRH
jgi:serine/threonine-protein kinase